MQREVSAKFPFDLKRTRMHDTELASVDVDEGNPIVFTHDNPPSPYTWRNVMSNAKRLGRWLASGLTGMRKSSPSPAYSYKFAGQANYPDAWPNHREISLRAKHYLPEDCPHEIGEAVAQFVTEVRGGAWIAPTAS